MTKAKKKTGGGGQALEPGLRYPEIGNQENDASYPLTK